MSATARTAASTCFRVLNGPTPKRTEPCSLSVPRCSWTIGAQCSPVRQAMPWSTSSIVPTSPATRPSTLNDSTLMRARPGTSPAQYSVTPSMPAGIDGVTLYCAGEVPGRARISVLSFNVEGLVAGDVGTMLDVDHGIACRTGLHCAPMVHEHLGTDKLHGSVRFGVGPFNTRKHVEAAVRAVADIAELGRRREG